MKSVAFKLPVHRSDVSLTIDGALHAGPQILHSDEQIHPS